MGAVGLSVFGRRLRSRFLWLRARDIIMFRCCLGLGVIVPIGDRRGGFLEWKRWFWRGVLIPYLARDVMEYVTSCWGNSWVQEAGRQHSICKNIIWCRSRRVSIFTRMGQGSPCFVLALLINIHGYISARSMMIVAMSNCNVGTYLCLRKPAEIVVYQNRKININGISPPLRQIYFQYFVSVPTTSSPARSTSPTSKYSTRTRFTNSSNKNNQRDYSPLHLQPQLLRSISHIHTPQTSSVSTSYTHSPSRKRKDARETTSSRRRPTPNSVNGQEKSGAKACVCRDEIWTW